MNSLLISSTNPKVSFLEQPLQGNLFGELKSKKLISQSLQPHLNSKNFNQVDESFFSEEQKARFQTQKGDRFLNKRYIAHLFGDSFMQNTIYEGWFISDALIHMIAILEENTISSEISQVLEDLKKCLAWQGRLISFAIANENIKIDSQISDEEQIPSIGNQQDVDIDETGEESGLTPLQKIVDEFKQAILNLVDGEKIVVPGGCRGHSVLYEIQRTAQNDYQFSVYNTGQGVEKHNIILEDEGSEKVYGVYRIRHIAEEHLANEKFLCDLFELKTIYPSSFGDRLYDEILPTLGGEIVESSADPDDYMLIQRSGTCSWKMLSAYLRYNMPLIQRKYIKLKARLDVFQKWYDLGYPLDCVKTSQELLSRLIINYKGELFSNRRLPMNFSREELLTMGIYKVKKTFNKYKFLLDEEAIKKADIWHRAFTGQSISAT